MIKKPCLPSIGRLENITMIRDLEDLVINKEFHKCLAIEKQVAKRILKENRVHTGKKSINIMKILKNKKIIKKILGRGFLIKKKKRDGNPVEMYRRKMMATFDKEKGVPSASTMQKILKSKYLNGSQRFFKLKLITGRLKFNMGAFNAFQTDI